MKQESTVTPAGKRKKKAPKHNPKFAGLSCEICLVQYIPHPTTGKYPRFITHHLHQKDPEITAVVCLSCHNWMHGNGKVYQHALKPRDMTDDERTISPFYFAAAVVELYDRKLIMPAVAKAVAEQRSSILNAALVVNPKKDTDH